MVFSHVIKKYRFKCNQRLPTSSPTNISLNIVKIVQNSIFNANSSHGEVQGVKIA